MARHPVVVEWTEEAFRFKANVPHPIPYQGSKRQIAPLILSFFPEHFHRFVEPFAGSAAVSLAVAYHGMAHKIIINDAHEPIADLWRQIIYRPEELSAKYRKLWEDQLGREREYYDIVRDEFNSAHQPDHFLYLLARCVKGAIRYNSNGEFNNSPDNRRKGATPENMRKRVTRAAFLLKGLTKVSAHDYTKVVGECDASDLIYMDPPYQGVCGVKDHRYAPKVDHSAFCDVLATLNDKACMFVISYDGRTGSKTFGQPLPERLGLIHLEIPAGRSTQATLLGRESHTYESLYLSPALAEAVSYSKKSTRSRERKRDAQKEFVW